MHKKLDFVFLVKSWKDGGIKKRDGGDETCDSPSRGPHRGPLSTIGDLMDGDFTNKSEHFASEFTKSSAAAARG
jgi:hypothetical protein